MGSIVMDGAILKTGVILGAGSLVPPGKVLNAGLWVGRPAVRKRNLTDEEETWIRENCKQYVWLKNQYLHQNSAADKQNELPRSYPPLPPGIKMNVNTRAAYTNHKTPETDP
eukprot:GHVT01037841.1.p1 GENE.GHVT01037841.1~~GHVT01037841.1.p1  ORF type:complete len:112 (-),score=18.27 GHVT01037841.1:272-607(-)